MHSYNNITNQDAIDKIAAAEQERMDIDHRLNHMPSSLFKTSSGESADDLTSEDLSLLSASRAKLVDSMLFDRHAKVADPERTGGEQPLDLSVHSRHKSDRPQKPSSTTSGSARTTGTDSRINANKNSLLKVPQPATAR